MRKATLDVQVAMGEVPSELQQRVEAFLETVGIGAGGSGGDADQGDDRPSPQRTFDAAPMIRFALEEGYEDSGGPWHALP